MQWLYDTLYWYLILLSLGLLFLPITRLLFSSFVDKGYAFARTIGILALSYLIFLAGSLKLLTFSQTNLIALLLMSTGVQALLIRHNWHKPKNKLTSSGLLYIAIEEVLFLGAIIFLAYIRGQEPSILSLEKFMDFGFMQSILRSAHFPPIDMWYGPDAQHAAGFPINYYYFGHLTGSVLIKLTGTLPSIGYNLVLASIFAQAVTMSFSLVINVITFFEHNAKKVLHPLIVSLYGLLGAFLVNLGGNLHTIYLFTKGYPNDTPVPFWQIFSSFNPATYWYPNATRFIPLTIHEFPSYSYVVADLHGHVFNIPFVLLFVALLLGFYIKIRSLTQAQIQQVRPLLAAGALLGFLIGVHYMTNAFDGPIYLLLSLVIFFFLFGIRPAFFQMSAATFVSFLITSLPFTLHFKPFVSGIGVNCAHPLLTNLQNIGPFIFEAEKCQVSPLWMLFVLWGFFLVCCVLFIIATVLQRSRSLFESFTSPTNDSQTLDMLILILFCFGIFLITVPEFFYVKDIYPAHFRANTMFKLGYQAFILFSLVSTVTLYRIRGLKGPTRLISKGIFLGLCALVSFYPFFSFTAYYGKLNQAPQLDGMEWLKRDYPEDYEIVQYLATIKGQPAILEAQGDSYTQFERISAMTGLPTVAGWFVHEWLWRGSPDVVSNRAPDIAAIYESTDVEMTKKLLKYYHVRYVVISRLEQEKYPSLHKKKFDQLGKKVFQSTNGFGALYQVN